MRKTRDRPRSKGMILSLKLAVARRIGIWEFTECPRGSPPLVCDVFSGREFSGTTSSFIRSAEMTIQRTRMKTGTGSRALQGQAKCVGTDKRCPLEGGVKVEFSLLAGSANLDPAIGLTGGA